MLFVRGTRIHRDVAGTTVFTAPYTLRRNHMLGGADGEARLRKIEIFAQYPEPAAESSGSAGVTNQLEPQHTCGKLALNDFDGRDLRIALIDCGTRSAVAGGPPARAA